MYEDIDFHGILASGLRTWSIPGASVVVVRSDAEVALVHAGYSDLASQRAVQDSTAFQIGSISKSFTGILFAQAAADGQIDLADPVTAFLPWLKADPRWSSITLRHLLNHTAGLVTCMDSLPDALAQAAATMTVDFGPAPGEEFHYSNVGYAILGLVMEAIAGESLGDRVRTNILEPVGMGHSFAEMVHDIHANLATGYVPLFDDRPFLPGDDLIPAPWFEFVDASGNIAATAHDMGKYTQMLLGRGRLQHERIISADAFRHLVEDLAPRETSGRPGRYGLGLQVENAEQLVLSHGGGMVGYSAHLIADLTRDLGVVVLSNAPGESGAGRLLAMSVMTALKSGVYQEVSERRVIEGADRYVGTFTDGSRTIRVSSAGGGRLQVESGGVIGELFETQRGWLACNHPELRAEQLYAEDARGQRRLSCGAHILLEEHQIPQEAPTATALDGEQEAHPLVGHYRSYSPWFPSFRIVKRGEVLLLVASVGVESPMGEVALTQIGDGVYRIGDDPGSPERLVCGPLIDGEIAWVEKDLCQYTRSFRP